MTNEASHAAVEVNRYRDWILKYIGSKQEKFRPRRWMGLKKKGGTEIRRLIDKHRCEPPERHTKLQSPAELAVLVGAPDDGFSLMT